MNWALLIAMLSGVGAGIYLLAQPLPDNWRDSEYRRHLTAAEKTALRQGQPVAKVHKVYPDIWKSYYQQGPLRVAPGQDGKFVFTPYGEWKQFRKSGELMSAWTYTGYGREVREVIFFPDGSPNIVSFTVPAVLEKDSVRETRIVYFGPGQPSDTLAVHHWFEKNGQDLGHKFWSFDAQGKRPVPPGWKLQR